MDIQAHNPKNIIISNVTNNVIDEGEIGVDSALHKSLHGILACSPMEFEHGGDTTNCVSHPSICNMEFCITNKVLRMNSKP